MKDENPNTIHLKDYTQPPYWITDVDLAFNIEEEETQVSSTLSVSKNESIPGEHALVLQGERLSLESMSTAGRVPEDSEYTATETDQTIHS